jgi:hypothetical protein
MIRCMDSRMRSTMRVSQFYLAQSGTMTPIPTKRYCGVRHDYKQELHQLHEQRRSRKKGG